MASKTPKPITRTVVTAAWITLAVTLLRLTGELLGWSEASFSTAFGGGGSLVGIGWLVPVFGAWFGWRLARQDKGPRNRGVAVVQPFVLFLLGLGAFVVNIGILKTPFPEAYLWSAGAWTLLALVSWRVWPALFYANLLYGLLARLPVVVITFVAVWGEWDVHYAKLGRDGTVLIDEPLSRALWLSFAQLGVWVPFTVLLGGFSGGIVALIGSRGVE